MSLDRAILFDRLAMHDAQLFVIRQGRKFEWITIIAFGTAVGFIAQSASKKPALWWIIAVLAVPLAVGLVSLIRSMLSRRASLVLDGMGIELVAGAGLDRQKSWRLSWPEIRSVRLIRSTLGDRLVFLTDTARYEVIVRLLVPDWKVERQEELFHSLTGRGLNPIAPEQEREKVVATFEVEPLRLVRSRTVIAFSVVALLLIVVLDGLQQKWMHLAVSSAIMLFTAEIFLSAARSRIRLDVTEETLTLRSLAPAGVLGGILPQPRFKEDVHWTVAWNELRRVSLSSRSDIGPGLWMELETAYQTVRLLFAAEGQESDRPDLRRLFRDRGFPIELDSSVTVEHEHSPLIVSGSDFQAKD